MTRRAALAVATLSMLALACCGTAAAAGGDGLNAEYFTNITPTDPPAATQVDTEINFNWGSGGPACISPTVDNFGVRWSGYVKPLYSETYTFYTFTDDGARLWVDGQLLVDKWINQAPTEWSGTVGLTAGLIYDIQLEYFEMSGGAVVELRWGSISQAKEIIPQASLFTSAGPSAPAITSVAADDPDDSDTIYSSGDTITITFDMDTNQSANVTGTKTGAEMNALFTLSGGHTFGGASDSYVLVWANARTLAVTVIAAVAATVDIGDTITILAAAGVKNAPETSANCLDTSDPITGDWGAEPAVTPFAGGCAGHAQEPAGLAVVLAAALGILVSLRKALHRKETIMSRRVTTLVMVVTLSVLVLAGCAGTFASAPDAARQADAPPGIFLRGLLAAAPEAGSAATDEAASTPTTEPAPQPEPGAPTPEGTQPEPGAPSEPGTPAAVEVPTGPALVPEPEAPEEPRARRFGVRAGVLVPAAAEDETYSESFTAGAFYAGELTGGLGLFRMPFEIGLDYARGASDDGRVDADLYSLRFDLLFSKWGNIPPRPDFYLLGGYQVVLASPDVDGEGGDTEYVSAFNLGLGLGSPETCWDARVAYSVLAGSGNVRGLLTATAGLRF